MKLDKCTWWEDGEHHYTFDSSNGYESVYCCNCSNQIIEAEDCGSGC